VRPRVTSRFQPDGRVCVSLRISLPTCRHAQRLYVCIRHSDTYTHHVPPMCPKVPGLLLPQKWLFGRVDVPSFMLVLRGILLHWIGDLRHSSARDGNLRTPARSMRQPHHPLQQLHSTPLLLLQALGGGHEQRRDRIFGPDP
jgi:hypothetical protein